MIENEPAAAGPTPSAEKAASVIRMSQGAEESAHDRLMKKHVPAWVISGAIHVVLLIVFILVGRMQKMEAKPSDEILAAVVDPKADEESQKDLTNPDLGLESKLPTAVETERVEDVNVDAKTVKDEPVGVAPAESTNPLDTPSIAGLGTGVDLGVTGTEGMFKSGTGGNNGAFLAPGMKGRTGATKEANLKAGGGNSESEAAVARGLIWLAKQQRANGSWVYDGSHASDTCASTAMSLLPFLAAGQTHKASPGNKYQKNVDNGLTYLIGLQNSGTGAFRSSGDMYSHAIAAIALCEMYGMTGDKKVLYPARAAINYIIKGQGPNGSWGYKAGTNGDTSIVGWQIQALKSAMMTKDIPVPDDVFKKARKFLDSVAKGTGSAKSSFGYDSDARAQPGTALSAVGLLCRYYMDGWGPVHPGLQDGVDGLIKRNPPAPGKFDMYYYYYATQVVHFHEGEAWHKTWNPKMRDMLIGLQIKGKGEKIDGSWDKDGAFIGSSCGRLGTTCMALLTLEVYYRHLPLYKRGNGGMNELERAK